MVLGIWTFIDNHSALLLLASIGFKKLRVSIGFEGKP
jgi:hypothetical protein